MTAKAKAKMEVDDTPPLVHKVGKVDRAKDEKKLKVHGTICHIM